MKDLYKILLLITFLLTPGLATAETVNYYVISKQAQPFQIEDNANNHSGIVTDIVQAIFSGDRYDISYHTYPFNRMISILEAGGEKNWITYGSPSWGSVQAENLSDMPIYTVKHALVTSKTGHFKFDGMNSLKGKGVVLLHGFDYPQLIPYISSGDVEEIRVKNYRSAFKVVNRTPGDTAFVEMSSRVKYNLGKLNLDKNKYDIQAFSDVIPDYKIYLAFDKNMDPSLQKFINKRLAELKKSGEIDVIISKYI
ncbi:transporter substrate-binding domain-containing protein [Vibrio sp. S4M6]|uniref:substrate-binding periplasmic protein n=1 Tax=Vibrio sinus TaxID=2946865 RepID=UPI00202A6F07|nr:transporter substrate-binding domain-containing protein [Vibrio sinus]MCL9781262.1 transporter substrate-binding domain-containing protein [Vibrio sinus]